MRSNRRTRVASVLAGFLLLSACQNRATKAVHGALARTLSAPSWQAIVDTPDGSATFDVQRAPVARIHLTGTADGQPYETFIDDNTYITTARDQAGAFIGFVSPCPGRTEAALTLIKTLISVDLAAGASYTADDTGYNAVVAGSNGRIHVDTADGFVQRLRFYGTPTIATSVEFRSVGSLPPLSLPAEDSITYPAIGDPIVPTDQKDTVGFLASLANCSR